MLINDIIDFILNLFRRKHRDVSEIELQGMLQDEEQNEKVEDNIKEVLEELAEQELENGQESEEEIENYEVSREQASGQVADEMGNEEEQGKSPGNISDGEDEGTSEGAEQETQNTIDEISSSGQGQEAESTTRQSRKGMQNKGQTGISTSQESSNEISEGAQETGANNDEIGMQNIDNMSGVDENGASSSEVGRDSKDINGGREEDQEAGIDVTELGNKEEQGSAMNNISDGQEEQTSERQEETSEGREEETLEEGEEKSIEKGRDEAKKQELLEAEERAKERGREMFGNIPKMEDMKANSTGGGYSLDYEGLDIGEIPDSVISMLIEKFLNERFLKKDNDLNRRTNSSKITEGYYDWDLNALIKDKVTKNYNQMLRDKQGYKYSEGNAEKIPFSFYFDLSGSMSEYSRLLSIIAVKLIKKDVKIITGFNENAKLQIDKVPHKFEADDFKQVLFGNLSREQLTRKGIEFTIINQDIDKYLISKGAEKSVIFSDFDPDGNIVNLAKHCQVYWFSFEKRYKDLTCGSSLRDFKGRFYRTYDIKDFAMHMKRITSRYHERQQRSMQLGE